MSYEKLNFLETPKGALTAWHCPELDNPKWDAFLNTSKFGHFYQTSMWARVRVIDGWRPLITIIKLNDQVIGGFQILLRSKSYLGKIGLLLKGPVVDSDDSIVINFVISSLKKTVRLYKIRALICQPPDKHKNIHDVLQKADFSPNHLENVIKNNTVIIDLKRDIRDIFKGIGRYKRKNIRKSIDKGVSVTEGDRNDINTFFRFMLETCKRQRVSPSPSSENFFIQVWDIFSRNGNIKLFFAKYNSEYVSANLVILFGDTAYLWKFGWSGEYSKYHPNELLYWEIIKWASANGYSYADMAAIDAKLADIIWHGETITEDFSKTSSYFKIGFGGDVSQLTNGYVYIDNLFLRWAHNFCMPYINSISSGWKRKILFKD